MNDTHAHAGANGDGAARGEAGAAKRRTPWPLIIVALLLVVVPALTWYLTWFGRSLDDGEITRYLSDPNPRHAQHALSQVAERVERGDKTAARWNPQVLALSQSPTADLRMTAAWVMGLEHDSEEFRAALARMLDDAEPIVRRNAALALVRFNDARSRPELLSMLRPYAVKAASGGTALTALTEGTRVKRGSLLVKFRGGAGSPEELRSPLPGRIERALVKDGDEFAAGSDLFILAPDSEQVGDALVGLFYVGDAQDLSEVERYADDAGAPADLKTKAAQVAEAIKRRSRQGR